MRSPYLGNWVPVSRERDSQNRNHMTPNVTLSLLWWPRSALRCHIRSRAALVPLVPCHGHTMSVVYPHCFHSISAVSVVFPQQSKLNGSRLEIVDSVKYMGITLSSDFSWSKHINIIGSKARKLVCFGSSTDVQTPTPFINFIKGHTWNMQARDPYLQKDQP